MTLVGSMAFYFPADYAGHILSLITESDSSRILVIMLALRGQSRINPIRFSLNVVFDVRIPKRRQFTGGRFRGMSGGA